MEKANVIVIGGGASGMMAAITAAREGSKVTILEHMDRVGKKILSTGNGRCNYTNTNQDLSNYHSSDMSFVENILGQFNNFQTLKFFDRLGVLSKNRDGYIYPYSNQASTILDVLRMELFALNVNVETAVTIKMIEKRKQTFVVHAMHKDYEAESLIIATGSKAAPASGSDGSGYEYATRFGHVIVPVVPALVQLRSDNKVFKSISGVRCEANVSLFVDGLPVAEDTGELQLTDYGISGIPVFQISRFASRALYAKKRVTVYIDFFPEYEYQNLMKILNQRLKNNKERTIEDALIGMINKKLITMFIKESGINLGTKCGFITEKGIKSLVNTMNNFKVGIIGTNSFDNAQTCAGGVEVNQLNPYTLESNYVKGLFFAGEIIDVDGACGGYNLQWAWSTGYVAGKNAALKKPVFNLKG